MGNVRNSVMLAVIAAATMSMAAADDNEYCLGCHGEKGTEARLYIDKAAFSATTHATMGCKACHASITSQHPSDGIRPSRASCGDCHDSVQKEYKNSLHASNARCNDCHNPHTVKNHTAVSGRDINIQCGVCHDHNSTLTSHASWLPQTELHMDAVPCITCHTGSENYYITLYMQVRDKNRTLSEYRPATHSELTGLAAGQPIQQLIDRNMDEKISLDELRRFNRGATFKKLRLLGTMKPEVMTHSYQILDNRWDCTFCHASGEKASQTSYVAIPDETGKYNQLPVEKGAVLDILYGTPDFYLLGAGRNDTLSVIGLLIVAGGLIMPVGHGTLRFLTRNIRKER